jgi:hypothetical protein
MDTLLGHTNLSNKVGQGALYIVLVMINIQTANNLENAQFDVVICTLIIC